ncbi:37S ribosomal protein S25, mitochondrial [Cyphellophora attinorum]|uniref:37S ribosomal protein S25, mitochondrial n=1 Tax=Cyphellophora attinorum TaxID=1664694 RepID=A0A0N1NZW8_9EURO|nr:37S ribosomal protein S25, mitochondrial [Phialophora attinorum]KPI42615.1 37S ribosomal protein S25, mitochondrial [Phialophora attinorum]
MGRINLSAQRVRQKALAFVKTGRHPENPLWADIMADVPPAQILTRQQPTQHTLTETRTTRLPDGKIAQTTKAIGTRSSAGDRNRRIKHIYMPNKLRYEEDKLRSQFFADHPWELARPRLLVETDGNQHAHADWSTGLQQPGIPVSGESVAQRQLWLLQNTPDITVPEAYDIARKEFYAIRRRQQIGQRIAAEEAENNGVDYGPSSMSKGMGKEAEVFDEWMVWAEKENMAIMQRQASFAGQQPAPEMQAVQANNAATESGSPGGGTRDFGVGIDRNSAVRPAPRFGSQIGESLTADDSSSFAQRQR